MEPSRLANLNALGQSSHLLGFNEPNFGAQVCAKNYLVLAFSFPETHLPGIGVNTTYTYVLPKDKSSTKMFLLTCRLQ